MQYKHGLFSQVQHILNIMATETNNLPLKKVDCKRALEAAGIIPTKQRLDIACAILSQPQHLSADQLLLLVNAKGANVSKATVYNTLRLFAQKGVVREVVVDPTRTFYDSNTDRHCHFYNEDTGSLTDVYSDCFLSDALPVAPDGTELVGIDVIIRVRNSA